MTPEIGARYVLLDTFAYSGLGWEAGTVVTVTEYPASTEHFGDTRCLARCGDVESQAELDILTPIDLLEALPRRRRRRSTPQPEKPKRRRRRR